MRLWHILQNLGTTPDAHLRHDQVGEIGSWVDAHNGTTYPDDVTPPLYPLSQLQYISQVM